MKEQEILAQLHPLERKILPLLGSHKNLNSLLTNSGLKEVQIMRALQWMANKKILTTARTTEETIVVDKNGEEYAKYGLPESKFLEALKGKMSLKDITKKAKLAKDEVNVCLGILKRKMAIDTKKQGSQLTISITPQGERLKQRNLEEEFLKSLPKKFEELKPEEKLAFENLQKRKSVIKKEIRKGVSIQLTELGKKLVSANVDENSIDQLTIELLKTRKWKGKKFRHFDVTSQVPSINIGKKHFENQVIDYIKRIWLELGFKEMKGSLVQSAFWDLDALFVPQDHPAREEQDTFYLKKYKGQLNTDLMRNVKRVHEQGLPGYKGWGGEWKKEEAQQMLLRTHTTVLSAQTISKLKESDLPAKFFSVAKVFRNETLDWKHAFEFYQVEGIVVDHDANLQHLKGYLKEFYNKMGYPKVRMRPGHFPYTEPSMEVDVWNEEKEEWIELGGSGIFRPEVTAPLFGKPVTVLAWGLGLGRLFDYFGIKDIRDINRNDVEQLRKMKRWLK